LNAQQAVGVVEDWLKYRAVAGASANTLSRAATLEARGNHEAAARLRESVQVESFDMVELEKAVRALMRLALPAPNLRPCTFITGRNCQCNKDEFACMASQEYR
jgi:hypothetical protein